MINTLIFDFGDVFINLDKPAIERSLKKLGVSTITNEMLEIAMKYEKGLITTDVFINSFTKKFPKISTREFTTAWNSIILDFPEHRLTFIENLARFSIKVKRCSGKSRIIEFQAVVNSLVEIFGNFFVNELINTSVVINPFSYFIAISSISLVMVETPNFLRERSIAGLSKLINTSPKSNIRVLII